MREAVENLRKVSQTGRRQGVALFRVIDRHRADSTLLVGDDILFFYHYRSFLCQRRFIGDHPANFFHAWRLVSRLFVAFACERLESFAQGPALHPARTGNARGIGGQKAKRHTDTDTGRQRMSAEVYAWVVPSDFADSAWGRPWSLSSR